MLLLKLFNDTWAEFVMDEKLSWAEFVTSLVLNHYVNPHKPNFSLHNVGFSQDVYYTDLLT